jgi:hypothetical protein
MAPRIHVRITGTQNSERKTERRLRSEANPKRVARAFALARLDLVLDA